MKDSLDAKPSDPLVNGHDESARLACMGPLARSILKSILRGGHVISKRDVSTGMETSNSRGCSRDFDR